MQLLNAEKIKDDTNKGVVQKATIVQKLMDQETIVAKRLNELLEKERTEKNRSDKDLKKHIEKNNRIKEDLINEVASLESRKKDALKPIDNMSKEAEKRLITIKEKEDEIERDKIALKNDRENLQERIENVIDRETDNEEQASEISKRKGKVKLAEDCLKKSNEELANKWIEFHKQVSEANEGLKCREKEINDGRKYIDVVRKEQKKQIKIIDKMDLAVQDKYRALEQAKIHLGINGRSKKR